VSKKQDPQHAPRLLASTTTAGEQLAREEGTTLDQFINVARVETMHRGTASSLAVATLGEV
jgi:hypothetical protein